MNTMGIIFILITAIMLIVSMAAWFIIGFNPCNLYNRIFNREDYKLWQFFIDNAGKFEYSYTYKNTVYYVATIEGIKYEAVIWDDDMYNGIRLTSIHKFKPVDDICGECLLSTFDKESSAAMTKALKNFNN